MGYYKQLMIQEFDRDFPDPTMSDIDGIDQHDFEDDLWDNDPVYLHWLESVSVFEDEPDI